MCKIKDGRKEGRRKGGLREKERGGKREREEGREREKERREGGREERDHYFSREASGEEPFEQRL